MNPYTAKSRRNAFQGAASGPGSTAFDRALRSVYDRARGKSSPGTGGVPIYVDGPHGRQCAGYVVVQGGRRVLRKTRVRESMHYCRKHDGYGVELDALRQAEQLGARAVRLVFDTSTGSACDRALEASVAAFANDGIRDSLGGFGTQVFLPVAFWRDLSDPQGSLFGGDSDD